MPGIRKNLRAFSRLKPFACGSIAHNFADFVGFIPFRALVKGRCQDAGRFRSAFRRKGFHVANSPSSRWLIAGLTFQLFVLAFQNLAVANDSSPLADLTGINAAAFASDSPQMQDTATLALHASATLTPDQGSRAEVIFLYSFPLPPGEPQFLGLKGTISLISESAVFNESLTTVATNVSGPCPGNGTVFPNYTAVYDAYPNILPLQSFILKTPDKGVSKVDVDYTMPAGVPVSDCIVVMLDWEGYSKVTMKSYLRMTYTTDPSIPSGTLLGTNQEFVFGIYIGPGSTKNDALSFVQETPITQPGKLLAFVGDVSDSTFNIPPPPGHWRTSNDIYLVPGRCPANIHVNSGGWTPKAGDYYSDIPQNARHLLSIPLSGFQAMAAQTSVYKPIDVRVEPGDCLLTLFGVKAPNGGGIDSENQVKTLFLPSE
jgi:hypothetical protein